MKIKWIGQSGYIIKTETTEIIIDPYLSDVVNRVANVQEWWKRLYNQRKLTRMR